jgi:murein tripeptide amidase MpaA
VAVRIVPRTEGELAAALAVAQDVWSEDVLVGEPLVVALAHSRLDELRAAGLAYQVIVEDIDVVARRERQRLAQRNTSARASDWFAEYRDGDEINAHLNRLSAQHPDVAQMQPLGTSLEGRAIRAIEISRGGQVGIALHGGQHAREWLSVMVPTCIADRLARGSDDDPRIRRILESVRFFIAPLVNPDGYHHSWTVDRYWRKNRRGGYGVDLNRNFGVGWGQAGSSGDRQSPNYRGEGPFSEPEARAVRELFENRSIAASVDFHSYSQLIVYPWSYQRVEPPDRDKFAAIADRMASAMLAAHGKRYAIRPGSKLQIGAGGTATDWSYGAHRALSFLVELRPASSSDGGFVLPREQIVPACEESLAAVLELADWVVSHARRSEPLEGRRQRRL